MSAQDESGRLPVRNGILAALCWCAVAAAGQPAQGQADAADTRQRPTPKTWIQRYLGIVFPTSARHFTVHYRSADEDVVLFSFAVAADDLPRLLNGRGIFPHYADLVRGSSAAHTDLARDSGSRHFAQKVAALKNVFSAIKERTDATGPREVQLWTSQVSVDAWEVCVAAITEKHADETIGRHSFRMPAASLDTSSCVVMDNYLVGKDSTRIWQRWSLDAPGYRQLIEAMERTTDAARYVGTGAEALANRLHAQGARGGPPWWDPSELALSRAIGAELVRGFCRGGSDTTTGLVVGPVDGLFRCYAYTQGHVLTPDPCDAVWGWLGLSLPARVRNACYESSSNPAGLVAWIRFDLPVREVAPCLAQASALPRYLEFTADPVVKDRLETAYQADAPPWWCPQELREGLYALRRTNTKELAEVCAGVGHLSPEITRVYIGLFSPW